MGGAGVTKQLTLTDLERSAPPDQDAVDKWVQEINALGRKLDEEASAIHPSAWPEALKDDMERWKKLAKEGPKEAPKESSAAQFVRDGLTACLPPGVPLSGQIVKAKWIGKNKALGTLTMFDGKQANVEVFKHQVAGYWGWGHQWREMEGGPCHWNGSEWERIEL